MIQACQDDRDDPELTNRQVEQDIFLDRPHTLLLMSTLPGKVAYRGVFTGALASEFAKADGKLSIDYMVTQAKREMGKITQAKNVEQFAETRNTLAKSLIFPPPGGGQQPGSLQTPTMTLIQQLEDLVSANK